MTTPLRTYEDYLKERGLVTTGTFQCPNPDCLTDPQPAFAIVEVAPGDWQCSTCHITKQVQAQAEAYQQAQLELPPWETEAANNVRAQRSRLQDQWRWTVMPDSPLNAAAKDRYMTMLQALNTITIDFQSPADVVWPDFQNPEANDYAAQ